MSWLFSQALVAAYSAGPCSDGEPCAQLNVMPTAQPFWRNDKPMDCSRFSRFGLTSRLLTDTDGEDVLRSFLADFPAKTSALPAPEMGLTEPDQVSGFRWPGSFAKYSPSGCSWKTRQCSLLGGLVEFSETWPRWGLMRNGECSARPTAELPTFGSESGLLPTPVAIDTGSRFNRSASAGAALRPTLGAMARFDLWPTPTASLGTKGGRVTPRKGREGGTLIEAVSDRMWPTPTAQDAKNNGGGSQHVRNTKPLNAEVGGQLNPQWVEWLMGWPIGWTSLEPLETDRYREWQQQHGRFSNDDRS